MENPNEAALAALCLLLAAPIALAQNKEMKAIARRKSRSSGKTTVAAIAAAAAETEEPAHGLVSTGAQTTE